MEAKNWTVGNSLESASHSLCLANVVNHVLPGHDKVREDGRGVDLVVQSIQP